MRILIIHSYYQLVGGEDKVFQQEVDLLRNEHNVETLIFNNKKGILGVFQFIFLFFNFHTAFIIYKKIKLYRPDIIHIHNLHYAVSPSVIIIGNLLSIPIIMTLHNYRLICPSGTLFHKGKLYTNSLYENKFWQPILDRVYKDSIFFTFWLSFTTWMHCKIGTWSNVSRFIVLNKYVQELLLKSKVPFFKDSNIVVKPNFTFPNVEGNHRYKKSDYFLYVGRLTEDKGIYTLLEAFKHNTNKLIIVGSGPLSLFVSDFCSRCPNIEFLDHLDSVLVKKLMVEAKFLIVPSIWLEPFGLVVIEALSLGTPVLCSQMGALKFIIKDGYNGFHFEAGSSSSLTSSLEIINNLSYIEYSSLCDNALTSYNTFYTPELNLKLLNNIYKEVILEAGLVK